MQKSIDRRVLLLVSIILVVIYTFYFYTTHQPLVVPPNDITTFEECAAAGYPIFQTEPQTCRAGNSTTYTRVGTNEVPTPIIMSGTYICLPKVNTHGPVTLECAFGLKTEKGYYALDNSSILTDNYPALFGGEKVAVEGFLVPKAMLSSDRWQVYDVIGVIAVDKIVKQ